AVVGVKAAAPITAEAPRARASLRNTVVLLSQGRARNVHPGHGSLAPLERFKPARPFETASIFSTPNPAKCPDLLLVLAQSRAKRGNWPSGPRGRAGACEFFAFGLTLGALSSDPCTSRCSAMQTTSDEVLISRIAGGGRLAMQVLYARHHVRVYRPV